MASKKLYDIWYTPSGNAYEKLNKIIRQLSKKYSTPCFEPHVTLIGGLSGKEDEIVSKTSDLAKLIHPPEIRLKNIDYSDQFFRCLFMKIEKNSDIVDANRKAKKIFGKYKNERFIPHLSL